MILLLAIVAGLIAGAARALINKRNISIPSLRLLWLVPIAFLPQFLAFQVSATSSKFPEPWIPVTLIGSQILLLIFIAVNLRQPGFWLLGTGLLLNITVITFNGGWMPISPETVKRLAPNAPPGAWEIGKRLSITKDKVIPISSTHLWYLSDRFVLPDWFHYHVAFSIGDVLIALGAIWFFWSIGRPSLEPQMQTKGA